jgi:membrane protein
VVLLVWVYYSSVILYFGAEFTKAYALRLGSEIRPRHYAVAVEIVTHEKEGTSIQENESEKETSVKRLPDQKKS